jgi:hypothetical protein
MKKVAIIMGMLMLSLAMVSAADFSNNVVVTGDWKWVSPNWQSGNFVTANVVTSAHSPNAFNMQVELTENLGKAWKYEGNTVVSADAPTEFVTDLAAITLNDPRTTPATGGFTQYALYGVTEGQFSQAVVSVSGQGAVSLHHYANVDSAAFQSVWVKVN